MGSARQYQPCDGSTRSHSSDLRSASRFGEATKSSTGCPGRRPSNCSSRGRQFKVRGWGQSTVCSKRSLMMSANKEGVLVVGQIPPPWHGQAVAINELIKTQYDTIDLQFVPMTFSDEIDDVGRFQFKKLPRLPVLVLRIWVTRFRRHCNVLYYPPGGTTIAAVIRDIVVLLSCRHLFRRVIFHSHAGGFAEVAESCPPPIRTLARYAYSRPDLLIQLTEKSPPDGVMIKAKRIVCVPCGLPDNGARYVDRFKDRASPGRIGLLFVGAVSAGKGIMVLLQACARLKESGFDFGLQVVGRFNSPEFEIECKSFVEACGISDNVEFLGVLTGDDKWDIFCNSDIFCFPSFYSAENQPLVILEAMQFGLPTVACDWRGISTMVHDGETGYIVPVRDSEALAEGISSLIRNPKLRLEMGARARGVFLVRYTDVVWRPAMETAIRGFTTDG